MINWFTVLEDYFYFIGLNIKTLKEHDINKYKNELLSEIERVLKGGTYYLSDDSLGESLYSLVVAYLKQLPTGLNEGLSHNATNNEIIVNALFYNRIMEAFELLNKRNEFSNVAIEMDILAFILDVDYVPLMKDFKVDLPLYIEHSSVRVQIAYVLREYFLRLYKEKSTHLLKEFILDYMGYRGFDEELLSYYLAEYLKYMYSSSDLYPDTVCKSLSDLLSVYLIEQGYMGIK